MMSTRPAGPTFREGDEVVLAQGTYPGTLGVFLRLKEDVRGGETATAGAAEDQRRKWPPA